MVAALRAAGITGWRRHLPLPGTPDFAFPKAKLAVFVDGCFWHGCPKHGQLPASNVEFWTRKITLNKRRDRKTSAALRAKGWRIIRCWEHDTRRRIEKCVRRIQAELDRP